MRTIKELLELMLKNQAWFKFGLCHWARNLYYVNLITFKENQLLEDYIRDNRPSIFSSLEAFKYTASGYFWKMGRIEPRIKWINKHIKKLTAAETVKLP